MSEEERLKTLEKSVQELQLELVRINIDVHMLKLLNKILSEVSK